MLGNTSLQLLLGRRGDPLWSPSFGYVVAQIWI